MLESSAGGPAVERSAIPVDKLILLSIVKQVPGIRRSRLRDAALATLSMDYFTFARALDELSSSKLIHVAVRKNEAAHDAGDRAVERCDLTESGLAVLGPLEEQIPLPTRRFLAAYLDEGEMDRRLADLVTASVEASLNGDYRLTLRMNEEGGDGMTLSLLFPTEKLARKAAAAWRERSDRILFSLMDSLLSEEDEKRPG